MHEKIIERINGVAAELRTIPAPRAIHIDAAINQLGEAANNLAFHDDQVAKAAVVAEREREAKLAEARRIVAEAEQAKPAPNAEK